MKQTAIVLSRSLGTSTDGIFPVREFLAELSHACELACYGFVDGPLERGQFCRLIESHLDKTHLRTIDRIADPAAEPDHYVLNAGNFAIDLLRQPMRSSPPIPWRKIGVCRIDCERRVH